MAKLTLEEILKRDQGYQAMAAAMKNAPNSQGSISAYNPGFGEKAANWFNETFYGGGKMAYSPARRLETALEWSPPGIAFNSGQAIGREMNKGDVGGVARESVMAVVPGAKKGGKLVEGLVKTAGKKLTTDVAKKASRKSEKTSDELLQEALATPRKTSVRGGYVGAPPSVGTTEQEQALVGDLLQRLKDYKGNGTNFYDDFQGAIRNWTNAPQQGQRFATASGHTSNQMSPLPNTNHALKAMNQAAVNEPIKAGLYPNASGAKIADDFSTGKMSADPKTGQYTYHLLPPEMRPADFSEYAWGGERAVAPGRAVHDTWDKEAIGYPRNPQGKQNAASDTEHLFMDRVYNKMVRQARRDPKLRARLGTGSTTYERAQADLWDIERRKKEKFDVLPAPSLMEQNAGFTQMAAIPGPSTGIYSKLLNAPLDVKRQYTDAMFNAMSDSSGGNIPARALGMSPPMKEGFGPWQGMQEPNRVIKYGVGTVGGGADKAIDPASAKAFSAVRDWNQLGLGQEGAGLTVPRADGATKAGGDLATFSGANLDSPEAYQQAFAETEKAFGPGWADMAVVQPGMEGGMMLKNISMGKDRIPNDKFHAMAQGVGAGMNGGGQGVLRDVGNDFRYVQFDQPGASPYVPDVWKKAPQFQNPTSYHRLLDDTRNTPNLKRAFDEKVLPAYANVQKESEAWAAKMGLPANTVPDRLRRILVEAGSAWPSAIDAAVKKGIIPAFAAAALYNGAAQFGGEKGSK